MQGYVREFPKIRLSIQKLESKEDFRQFADGLKPCVRLQLQRRDIRDLKIVLQVCDFLIKYKQESNTESKCKGKEVGGRDKFMRPQQLEKGKAIQIGDSIRREHQPGPVKCFLCDRNHKAKES